MGKTLDEEVYLILAVEKTKKFINDGGDLFLSHLLINHLEDLFDKSEIDVLKKIALGTKIMLIKDNYNTKNKDKLKEQVEKDMTWLFSEILGG